jgi:hypothetical protein
MKLLFLILFLSTSVFADDVMKISAGWDASTDVLSEQYDAGQFLIYDCTAGHWVCVLEEDYKECEALRDKDKETSDIKHKCAPVGKFETKKSCFQRQLFMTSNNFSQSLCVKDDWKVREVDF